MGRDMDYSKEEVEYCNDIDVFWLKKHGYFCGHKSGGVEWTRRWSEQKSSVGILVDVMDESSKYMRLMYSITDNDTGEKVSYDYKVEIVTTECHFGGVRYWFICPLVKNGVPCRERVAKLYMRSRYFGCRKCHELVYSIQRYNSRTLQKPMFRAITLEARLERLHRGMKVRYYKGKATRKYKQILKIYDELDSMF